MELNDSNDLEVVINNQRLILRVLKELFDVSGNFSSSINKEVKERLQLLERRAAAKANY